MKGISKWDQTILPASSSLLLAAIALVVTGGAAAASVHPCSLPAGASAWLGSFQHVTVLCAAAYMILASGQLWRMRLLSFVLCCLVHHLGCGAASPTVQL